MAVTVPSPSNSIQFQDTCPLPFSSQNYSVQTHRKFLLRIPLLIRIRIPIPIPDSNSQDCINMPDGSKLCRWRRPEPDYVAINCDASFHPRKERIGYGFIVRDYRGDVIMAKAKCRRILDGEGFNGPILVLKTELMVIRDGLREMAKNREDFPLVEVQSDSKNAVDILKGDVKGAQECDDVLKEINAVRRLFEGCSFQFVFREGNRAADFMSKYLESDGKECLSELPPDLGSIVEDDARGLYVKRSRKY